jgi:hypothetical protein
MTGTVIVTGMVASADGISATVWLEAGSRRQGHPTLCRGGYYSPAANYLAEQPERIAVGIGHDGKAVGEVKYLTRGQRGLFAVCEVSAVAVEGFDPLYLSGDIEGRYSDNRFNDIVLHSVALVPRSASVGKWPAAVIDADLDKRDWPSRSEHRVMLAAAADYCRDRRRAWGPGPHLIADADRPTSPVPIEARTSTAFDAPITVSADVAGRIIADADRSECSRVPSWCCSTTASSSADVTPS